MFPIIDLNLISNSFWAFIFFSSRSWCGVLVIVFAIVCGTLAAPQQDRRTIKVGASFGGRSDVEPVSSGRALPLFEEPRIITEPLPGQEFVFISANTQAAGGREPRVNSEVPQLPSVRIENVPGAVLDEDGILVAGPVEESVRDGREFDARFDEAISPPLEVGVPNRPPLSLPELLAGPAVVRELTLAARAEEIGNAEDVPDPVPEQFSITDAVTVASQTETAHQLPSEENGRQSKAIGSAKQEEQLHIIPAESVSRRTVIKTAPNGQDYEYEYLYYDGTDVEEANGTSAAVSPKEPTLFANDQENSEAPLVSTNETDAAVSQSVQPVTDEQVIATTEADLVEVQEVPHVAKVAFQVGDTADISLDGEVALGTETATLEDVDITTITEAASTTSTEATTTTTTTTPAPTTSAPRRRRPVRPTTAAPARVRTPTTRKGSATAAEETTTAVSATKRVRGKNSSSNEASQTTSNAVTSENKSEGSGRRRITISRGEDAVRPWPSTTLENRAGLAQVRLDFDGEEFFEVATDDPQEISNAPFLPSTAVFEENLDSGKNFEISHQSIEHVPINGRFPPRHEVVNESPVQERTPLRIVESSSFRNTGNQALTGEQQITAGRLTVISGPARLPPPLVPAQVDTISQQEEVGIRPVIIAAEQGQDVTESDQHAFFELETDVHHDQEVVDPEVSVTEIDHQITEDVATAGHQDDANAILTLQTNDHAENGNLPRNRPDVLDLLALSRAVEQQEQDEQQTHQVSDVEEVLIEEVVATTVAPIAATTAAPTTVAPHIPSFDEQVVSQIAGEADAAFIEKAHVQQAVEAFLDETVTMAGPDVLSIEQVLTDVEPALEPVVIAAEELQTPKVTDTTSDDAAHDVFDVQNVVVKDVLAETTTATTTTTTTTTTEAPTTTTTAATTTTAEAVGTSTEDAATTPSTTTAGSRIRGPSRFSANANANRFNTRIRNRVRGGENTVSSTSTTTTSTTPAPVRKSSFRPGGAPFNRLRRPTTPATEIVKDTSSEVADNNAVKEATEAEGSPLSVTATTTTSTTRRPTPVNIRSRFNIRRNQTATTDAKAIVAVEESSKVTTSTSRPRAAVAQTQSNRIASPRPMSSILKRGRFTSTTTTTETTVTVAEDAGIKTTSEEVAKEVMVNEGEVTATDEPEVVPEKVVTETTSTTTTTTRSVGLNRLRTRVPLAVSERPKTVRTQVSLTDRRNRFSVLSNSRRTNAEDSSPVDAENKKDSEKAVASSIQQEEPVDNDSKASVVIAEGVESTSDNEGVEVAVTVTATPLTSRVRRPSRIPGQLVARRTSSS